MGTARGHIRSALTLARPGAAALALVGALAAAAALSACGEKETRTRPAAVERLTVVLESPPNAAHAGIYAARENGHFAAVGLGVRVRRPPDPAAPLRQLAAGRADLAISHEPELLQARDRGAKAVSVAALVRVPLAAIPSLPREGVPPQSPLVREWVRETGGNVPTYDELAIVAREGSLERDAGRIRAFLAALERGTRDVRRDVRAGVGPLVEAGAEPGPRTLRRAVRAILPALFPPTGRPFGHQGRRRWDRFARWMLDERLVDNTAGAGGALTDALLPGQGPR